MCPRNSDPRQTTYTYDTNGNQASAGSRTFTYNLADRLVSTTNAGTTTTYAYDGNGRRISSTTGGGGADLRYVWDPLAESGIPELALERTPAGALVRRYLDDSLGAFALTNASATFYYHRDPLGTITDVTDASGAAQWKYEYEANGAERTATNVSGTAPENHLRFNNQYLDSETSLYHLRARQYDPTTGRFDALDPVENPIAQPYGGPYVYVNGSPTVLVDPLGLSGLQIQVPSPVPSLGDLKQLGRDAANFGRGAANFAGDLDRGMSELFTDPVGAGKATHERMAAAYRAFDNPLVGGLMAANQLIPLYSFTVDAEVCLGLIDAGGAEANGYSCASAAFDVLTVCALGARAATGGVAAEGGGGRLGRIGSRLADETGSVRPPVRTPWGWSGSRSYRAAVAEVDAGGTLKTVGRTIPTRAQAEMLIEDAGGTVQRIEGPHLPPNPHQYHHINYTTSSGLRGTVQIKP
jgi:RHS repeat-associated protein